MFPLAVVKRMPSAPVRLSTVLATAVLSGCAGPSVLSPHGTIAAGNRIILLNSLTVMLALVVPTIIGILVFAWWFRTSNGKARYRPDFTFSGKLEVLIWSVPLLVIMFLGGIIWIGSHELDPYKPLTSDKAPLEVQVVSLDWKWLFIYPDLHVASVNELVIPAETPVHLSLTSGSVMNSFFVPQLGSMVAVMYGMATQLHLMADHPGEFYGQSTQFSGQGFADMNFAVRSIAPDAFEGWTSSVKQSGSALDLEAYKALEAPSQKVPVRSFGQVEQGLFDKILRGEPEEPSNQTHQHPMKKQEAAGIAR